MSAVADSLVHLTQVLVFSRGWVKVLLLALVSLRKLLYYNCFSAHRGYKWVPARVEVDIVFEKAG